MTNSIDRVNACVAAILEAVDDIVSAKLAEHFPDAPSGDVAPDQQFRYSSLLIAAVHPLIEHWAVHNVPDLPDVWHCPMCSHEFIAAATNHIEAPKCPICNRTDTMPTVLHGVVG